MMETLSISQTKISIMNPNDTLRVGIIVWDIGQIGGIATQAVDFKRVLDFYKIENDIIILTDKKNQGGIDESRIEAKGQSFKLKGIELSVDYKNLNWTLNFLDKRYNTFLFLTACIHNDNTGWLSVFQLRKKNIVIISDVYLDKFYPYFNKAFTLIDSLFATNRAVKNYLREKGIEAEELIHPFEFDSSFITANKGNAIIWANQWRGWKGIRWLMRDAEKIKGQIYLFGSGREYSNFKDKIPKNAYYQGFQPMEAIREAYVHGRIALDLTGQSEKYYGHYNRTTIEPMFWKCAMVCNEKLVEPYSFIPQNVVCAVNKENFIDKINDLLINTDNWLALTERAFKWATERYQWDNVIKQITG